MNDALEIRTSVTAVVRPTNYSLTYLSSTTSDGITQGEMELEIKVQRNTIRRLTGLLPLFTTISSKPFLQMQLFAEMPVIYRLREEGDEADTLIELSAKVLWISVDHDIVTLYIDGTGRGIQITRREFIDSLVNLYTSVNGHTPIFTSSNVEARAGHWPDTTPLGANAISAGRGNHKDMAIWSGDYCSLAEYRMVTNPEKSGEVVATINEYSRVSSTPIRTLTKDADGVWNMRGVGWYTHAHEARLVSLTRDFAWI